MSPCARPRVGYVFQDAALFPRPWSAIFLGCHEGQLAKTRSPASSTYWVLRICADARSGASPAARGSASPSVERCCPRPKFSCSTSRWRPSTLRDVARFFPISNACATHAAFHLLVSHAVFQVQFADNKRRAERWPGHGAGHGFRPHAPHRSQGRCRAGGHDRGAVIGMMVLSELDFGGGMLLVRRLDASPGTKLRVRVAANDVMLSLNPLTGVSANNARRDRGQARAAGSGLVDVALAVVHDVSCACDGSLRFAPGAEGRNGPLCGGEGRDGGCGNRWRCLAPKFFCAVVQVIVNPA